MNSFEKYLDVLPEIQQALDENKPVVALESTILSHGMPYPENLDFAHRVEEVIRSLGGIPATCAIVKGRLKVGLTAEELEIMCRAENIGKVSRRDVAVYVALGRTGATTVASTMIIAAMAGIPVFATGGILVGNPVPEEYALDHEYMERIINVALQAADEANVHGKNITPFLLAKVKELTGGESFETNVQLALNNARCATRIAAALCELRKAE